MQLHYFQAIFQDFLVDYDSIDLDDILNIQKYLMKKYDIK